MHSYKKIPVANLTVNIENPRYEMVGNQPEAIGLMVKEQKKKIVNLAEDIVQNGLNPSELPIVAPHEREKGHFNVLEGNRRVVALKLLHMPDLVKDHKTVYKKIKDLSHKFRSGKVTDIDCVVFPTAEEANRWIKLKHTGENDGVGVVRWDAQQAARFDERISGKSPVALQAIDFLRKNKNIPQDVKDNLKKLPSTNIDRLLRDKGVQELIGVIIVDGRLQAKFAEDEVAKGMTKIARDLIQGKIKVKDIYTKVDREKYIETFKQEDIPQKANKAAAPWELASRKITSQITATGRKRPISYDRRWLIPKDCVLRISDQRVNKIYSELKSLDCEQYPNAAGVLFRVFVELSMDAFVDGHKHEKEFAKIDVDKTLNSKVAAVADYFARTNVFTKHQLKGIRTAVSTQSNVLSIETFNAYVHNRYFTPLANDLKAGWDNIQPFICKVWE